MSQSSDTTVPLNKPRFQAGGALEQGSFYIHRPADEALFNALSAGQYCHVLAPRQIGKTSLCVRAAVRLKAANAQVAFVDLSPLGTSSPFDQWIFAIASVVARELGLQAQFQKFWSDEEGVTPGERFGRFLSDVVLPNIKGRVFVFFDEIDTVLERGRNDTDRRAETADFFSVIRSLHNQRARDPALERLVFCFSGVASPADLVQESGQSPFVVSRAIELRDFTREQLSSFESHICPESPDPKVLLDEVYSWTSGHPYMTQHLCEEMAEGLCNAAASPKEVVQAAVDRRFLGPRRHDDVVLSLINRYLSKDNPQFPLARMLQLYRQLREKEKLRFDPKNDAQLRLMLTGLAVTVEDGSNVFLALRNRILKEVFDKHWVEERESELHLGEPLLRWLHAPANKKDAFVLRGLVLREALDWQSTHTNIQPQERDFIEASLQVELRERERELEGERRQKRAEIAEIKRKEAEQKTKKTRSYAALIGTLLGLLVLVVGAAYQRERIQTTQLIQGAARLNDSYTKLRKLSESFSEATSLEQKARFAVQMPRLEADKPSSAESVLVGTLTHLSNQSEAGLLQFTNRHPLASHALLVALEEAAVAAPNARYSAKSGQTNVVAFSPDGRRMIAGDDGCARLWDLTTGLPVGGDLLSEPIESIKGVTFSEDGKLVVTTGGDGVILVWNPSTGELIRTLKSHSKRVSSVHIWGEKNRVLTSGEDGMVQIQDLEGNQTVLTPPSAKPSYSAAVSPNGAWIAAATDEGKIQLWTGDGRAVPPLVGHEGSIYDLAFSPDGNMLVSGSADKTVRVWDVPSQKLRCTFRGHEAAVASVTFSSDGTRVLSVSAEDGVVSVWDAQTCQRSWSSSAASTPVTDALFLEDDARVITGSTDGLLRILDARDGRLLSTVVSGIGAVRDIAVSPKGTSIIAASADGSATVWDVPYGRPTRKFDPWSKELENLSKGGRSEHRTEAYRLAYSADGRHLWVGYGDGMVRKWSVDSGGLEDAEHAHSNSVRVLVSSKVGGQFATVGRDSKVLLWRDAFGKKELAMSLPTAPPNTVSCKPIPETSTGLYAAEIDDTGTFLAAGGADCLVRIWSAGTGELLFVLSGHEGQILSASFSPDGKLLSSMDSRGVIHVWDTSTGEKKLMIRTSSEVDEQKPDPVSVVRFLSASRLLSGFKYEEPRLWDVTTGKEITKLVAKGHWILRAEPSAGSSEFVATSSWDQSTRIWEVSTGKLLASLWGHEGPVRESLWTADNKVLWTASTDGYLRVWNTQGEMFGQIPVGGADIWDIALSPDGQFIAVADARGVVRTYPATLQGAMLQACDILAGRKSFGDVSKQCDLLKNTGP